MTDAAGAKSFRKKFLELASGSALAQAASLMVMPLLSRLYSPEDFGGFAVYFALANVLGLLSTLRFDVAIVLAEDDEEAAHLVWLSLSTSVVVTLIFSAVMILCAWLQISNYVTFRSIPFTSVSILAYGTAQTLLNWHSRVQNFQVLGLRNVAERVITLCSGIGFALIGWQAFGLIYAQTLGLALSVLYLFFKADLRVSRNRKVIWRHLVRRYSDFPLRYLPSTLFSAGASNIMALLFARYFTRGELGQFNLASRILEAPINLIGNTFSIVYYQTTSQRSVQERRRLFLRSLKALGILFALPMLVLGFSGPALFSWVFGASWAFAGSLAQILGTLTLFRLFFVSQSSLLLVQRKLNIDLTISILMFTAQVGGFALGLWAFSTLYGCVVMISFLGSLVFVYGLYQIHTILRAAEA